MERTMRHETMFQSAVAEQIMRAEDRVGERVSVSLTDNQRAIIIEINGRDAAWTADEARGFADDLETHTRNEWATVPQELVGRVRRLADIVDQPAERAEPV